MSAEAWAVFAVVYVGCWLAAGAMISVKATADGIVEPDTRGEKICWLLGGIWPVLIVTFAAIWIVAQLVPEPGP